LSRGTTGSKVGPRRPCWPWLSHKGRDKVGRNVKQKSTEKPGIKRKTGDEEDDGKKHHRRKKKRRGERQGLKMSFSSSGQGWTKQEEVKCRRGEPGRPRRKTRKRVRKGETQILILLTKKSTAIRTAMQRTRDP